MRNHSKFLTNKKQDALYSNEEMHLGNMIDGQVSISNNKSSSPSLNIIFLIISQLQSILYLGREQENKQE